MPRRRAVLCDLDGTLARISPERHPLDADLCGLDEVNRAVLQVLLWAREAGWAVVLVSGRGYQPTHRRYTEHWLAWNEVPWDALFMRQPFDGRKDFIVKKEIYSRDIEPYYDVQFAMDDRRSVVDMWRHECGLEVFQLEERID